MLRWWPLGLFRLHPRAKSGPSPHVAYIMWHFPLLSETFIQREIDALKRKGLRITIIADAVPDTSLVDDLARQLIQDTVPILPLDVRRSRTFTRSFARRRPLRMANLFLFVLFHRYHEKKSYRFDREIYRKAIYIAGVCHDLGVTRVHAPWADLNAWTGLLAARLLGVPYTVQARAHDLHRRSYRYGLKEKFRYAEFVFTNTEYNVRELTNIMGRAEARKIVHIYNGIPTGRFPYRTPKPAGERPIRILTVARLIEQKGIDDLLAACAQLRQQGVRVFVSIIGEAEEGHEAYADRIRALRTELGLEDCVDFAGARNQDYVIECHGRSDIFVLPCKIAADGSRDIIPNALIEAMASGLPCISSRITGIPEIIGDRVDGLLVAPARPAELAGAIGALVNSHALCLKLSANARRKVETRFDINKNSDHYLKIFSLPGATA